VAGRFGRGLDLTREALSRYDGNAGLPSLVRRVVTATRDEPDVLVCLPEVGRLLQLLAAGSGGRVAELGTGWGVGTARLASGLPVGGALVTIEIDPERAAWSAQQFAGDDRVQVIAGDWTAAEEAGPYDLVFNDGGPKREPDAPSRLKPLLRKGGLVVLDDFTPGRTTADDPVRRIWLENSDWLGVELQVAADAAVILAVAR